MISNMVWQDAKKNMKKSKKNCAKCFVLCLAWHTLLQRSLLLGHCPWGLVDIAAGLHGKGLREVRVYQTVPDSCFSKSYNYMTQHERTALYTSHNPSGAISEEETVAHRHR